MARTTHEELTLIGVLGILGSIACAIFPLLLTFVAGVTANALKCRLDEAASYPCLIGGIDIGGFLSLLGLMGWLSFFTIPIGAIGVLLSIGVLVVGYGLGAYRRRKKRKESSTSEKESI